MAIDFQIQPSALPGNNDPGECRTIATRRGRSLLAAVGVLSACLFALVLLMLSTGCTTIKDKIAGIEYPEPTPDPVPAESGLVAAGTFVRPVIGYDAQGRLQIAVEGPKMQSLHLYTLDAGKWRGGEIVRASKETALRCYVPDLQNGVVSWRWGKKDGGVLHGPGLYVNGKTSYPGLTHGAARLAEHDGTVYLMSKDGAWGQVNPETGDLTMTGTYPAGLTGEKFAFVIDESGIWHTAHNGSSMQASAVCINGKRQTWASYETYPEQGDDLRYVDICAANGKTYISTVLGGDNRVQVMDAGKPRYSLDALPSLGKGSLEQRCPPRLVAGPAGVVAIWRAGKAIVAVNVEQCLAGTASPRQIATGEFPAAAVGPDGTIHLVYVAGGLRYKEIAP